MIRSTPRAVLFMCTMNQIRSPMASALARDMYGQTIYVRSAGVTCGPTDDVFVQTVMAEVGVNTEGRLARQFTDLKDGSFDLLITLSHEAAEYAQTLSETMSMTIETWQISDPSRTSGNRETIIEAYRMVRDELRCHLINRFGLPLVTTK